MSWLGIAVSVLALACDGDRAPVDPGSDAGNNPPPDGGMLEVPVERADPTSAVGAACNKPPGPPVGAAGCDEACVSTHDGDICTTTCSAERACPSGYECREDAPHEPWCWPIDARCPPAGAIVGRDARCGCLGGVAVLHDWSCVLEQVGQEVFGACDGYCSLSCEGGEACPEGFSCRPESRRGPPRLRCLSDAPLEGTFSERSPPDMAEVAVGSQVQLRWSFAGGPDGRSRASYFDVAWGDDPEALNLVGANGLDSLTGSYNLPPAEVQAGRRIYWQVVATGNGGLRAHSPVWSFSVGGPGAVQTPCPDQPSVTIGGRAVGTVQIHGRCWTRGSFAVGARLGGAANDTYFDDGQVQHGMHSNAHFYAWWEAHNAYPLDASMTPRANLVGSSICPEGWRLPTRAEMIQAVQAGNEMRPGQQSNALDYGWIGWFPPVTNGPSRCPRPAGKGDDVFCGRFGARVDSGTYMFLVGPGTSATTIPIVSISRPASGSSDFRVEQSNTGSPWAGYQLRCIRAN